MAKFKIRPYDDYKAWDTAETIEEARDKRSKLAMSFFSRAVVIEDTNNYSIVDWVLARVDNYHSSLSLLLQLIKKEMRVLIKKRTRLGHQEKNKTRRWKVSKVPYKTFKTFRLFINLIIGELYYASESNKCNTYTT